MVDFGQARQSYLRWKLFKSMYNKAYSDTDDEYRRKIWEDNMDLIETHNQKANQGKYTFWLKSNRLADMTTEEVYSSLYGNEVTVNISNTLKYIGVSEDLPFHVDWRAKNVVTAVKDQGNCNACYAFAATGALEGQNALTYGKLVSLSEQNIIDCTNENKEYKNYGCSGGNIISSFHYVEDNRGIDTEESYPYVEKVQKCKFKKRFVGSKCKNFAGIIRGNESDLQRKMAEKGPVAVGVDTKHTCFRFYSHGVYDNPDCSSSKLNHAMLVVGYGSRDNVDYWLVKNSWGRGWGMDGYVKMSRNKNNQCGIASDASFPIL